MCNIVFTIMKKLIQQISKFLPFKPNYIILGIETSCDDTACAIVSSKRKILGEFVQSQQEEVLRFGGIMPVMAKELHNRNIQSVVSTALKNAELNVQDVDAIAVTSKPGLIMSLLVGMNYAKMLSKTYKKPFLPIHHMEAHALTVRLINRDVQYPFLTFLISGGHCLLAIVRSVEKFILLGKSLDNAPGEVFDKVARRLKLNNLSKYKNCSAGYSVEDCAKSGNSTAFVFSIPALHHANCNFYFSGLMSSVMKIISEEEEKYGIVGDLVLPNADDICASFQYTATKHLAMRLQRAMEFIELNELLPSTNLQLVISGGAACNSYFQRAFNIICEQKDYKMYVPPPKYCSDNGVMIAWNGIERYEAGVGIFSYEEVDSIIAEDRSPFGEDLSEDILKAHIKCKWIKLNEIHTNKDKISNYKTSGTSEIDDDVSYKDKNNVQSI